MVKLRMPQSLLDLPTVYGARAKLGIIVPLTNTANEAEWNHMAPPGVSIHAARMLLHSTTESPEARALLHRDIERYANDLAQASVDLIVYACTAGSMTTIEPLGTLNQIIEQKTAIQALNTAQAIVLALQTLNVQRIAVATPYHQALNSHEAAFLNHHGFDVIDIQGLGYGENGPAEYRNIARIQPHTVFDLVQQIDTDAAQAILISCTDLASLAVIADLENTLGKPVISSNSATFWAALRATGVSDSLPAYGALLAHY